MIPLVLVKFCRDATGSEEEYGFPFLEVNFKGMVETPDQAAYATVDVYPDRLEVNGFGLEPSRVLGFSE